MCAGMVAVTLALASAPLHAAAPPWAGEASIFATHDSWIEAAAPSSSLAGSKDEAAPSDATATDSSVSEHPASPVPEPDVWAMLASGFGLIVFMARRRLREE